MNSLSLFVFPCLVFVVAQAQTVRQCSCDEGQKCMADLKQIANGCVDSCWSSVNSITNNPQALRQCFSNKNNIVDSFIGCIVDGMGGCAADANGPQIPKQNFDTIITSTEDRIRKTTEKSLNDNKATLQPVIDAAEAFGACAKTCIRQQIGGDFCLSKYNCQPQMPDDATTRKLMHSCTAKQDIKHHAGEVCDCALAAGVTQLQSSCSVLDLLQPAPLIAV